MTWYDFESQIALDQETETLARNTEGSLYAPGDTAFATPLTVTDLAGVEMTAIRANGQALLPQIRVEDHKVVIWKSGQYKTVLLSISGVVSDVQTAQEVAQQAYSDVQAYIATHGTSVIPSGGSIGQVLARSADGSGLQWVDQAAGTSTGTIGSHGHVLTDLTDSSSLGRSLVAASSAQAARALIGAGTGSGTSNLVLGTTWNTAAAGNHLHSQYVTADTLSSAIASVVGGGSGSIRFYTSGGYPAPGDATGPLLWVGPVAPVQSPTQARPGDVWLGPVSLS